VHEVRHTAIALGEIDEICACIAKDSVVTAADVADAIERTVALIGKRSNFAPLCTVATYGRDWFRDSGFEFSTSLPEAK
jgi:hypothetical protein